MKNFLKTVGGKALIVFLINVFLIAGTVSLFFTLVCLGQVYIENIQFYHWIELRFDLWKILIVISILFVIFHFVLFLVFSGKRPNVEQIDLPVYKVPYDILLVGVGLLLYGFINLVYLVIGRFGLVICDIVTLFVAFNTGLYLLGSLVGRIRNHVLIKRTLVYYVIVGLYKMILWVIRGYQKIPFVWKAAIGIFIFLFVFLVSIFFGGRFRNRTFEFILWLICLLIISPVLLYFFYAMQKLQNGAKKISEGDFTYKIDDSNMIFDFKKHAEYLNHISTGIELAVTKQLKSERMKTEMLTNVSHDLKTPLTSLINYAELISKEETENENIKEYSEVLLRQSKKMKRLIEDILEVSKATTGNLEVSAAPCSASVFLTQLSGEYEERLLENNLTLILNVPEEDIQILVDGRRMWRIFDNLMNNICKYALPGTRVYVSLKEEEDTVSFEFKNISKDPLNITSDELLERFTRGDASRNTEGNGLGLSICDSFIKAQKGFFTLSIDGDLFKATVSVPKVNS